MVDFIPVAQPFLINLQTLIEEQYSERQGLLCKHFFSGAALYCNGAICVTLTPAGLAFKLPSSLCSALIDSGEATQLRYFEKSPIKKGYALFADYEKLEDGKKAKYFDAAVTHAMTR